MSMQQAAQHGSARPGLDLITVEQLRNNERKNVRASDHLNYFLFGRFQAHKSRWINNSIHTHARTYSYFVIINFADLSTAKWNRQ